MRPPLLPRPPLRPRRLTDAAPAGSAFTSSRLIYAAAREGCLPARFGRLHARTQTPLSAMGLQAGLTTAFVVLGGGFRRLVNFSVVAAWTFYFLTVRALGLDFGCEGWLIGVGASQVLGVLVLRVKEPELERCVCSWASLGDAESTLCRPYKTWITTPLIFCGVRRARHVAPSQPRHPVLTAAPHQVCVFLLSMPVKAAPTQALAAACFILAGVPVYYLAQRGAPSPCAAAVGARLPCVCVCVCVCFICVADGCCAAAVRNRVERLRAGEGWAAGGAVREDRIELVDSAREARFYSRRTRPYRRETARSTSARRAGWRDRVNTRTPKAARAG